MGLGRGGGSPSHKLFLLLVGLAGWSTIVLAAPRVVAWPSAAAAALFLAVVAGARALAFPLAGDETEVSLDSGIFIAATACLGALPTAIGVAVVLSADSLVRGLKQPQRTPCAGRDPLCLAAHTIYLGGLSGGLLVLLARVLYVDVGPSAEWQVPVLGGVFLISHYFVQTVQLRLAGQPWRSTVKRNAIGMAAEATLLPLAASIALMWRPGRVAPFALLGATYLLINLGFHRMSRMAFRLRKRALELETLNRTAHALSSTLELPQLLAALLAESARALPQATRLHAVLASGGPARRYHRSVDGKVVIEPADREARSWLGHKAPALETPTGTPGWVRERLIAPMMIYGDTIGALVAESPRTGTFGDNHLRVLDAIAGHAATAVENARLYGLANIDGLTGLYCRRYLDARVAEEIERARRFDSTFALLLLDLDDFKHLNDTLGHQAGDRALREVAAIAASQLRGVDLAARYGGEELAFLLPRTSLGDAAAVAERIREAVATHAIVENGHSMRITASIGVAGFRESGVDDGASLVARADAALYRAKAAGKDRVSVDIVDFEIGPSLAPVQRRRRA